MPLKVPHRRAFKPLHTFFLLTWHCLYLQKKEEEEASPLHPGAFECYITKQWVAVNSLRQVWKCGYTLKKKKKKRHEGLNLSEETPPALYFFKSGPVWSPQGCVCGGGVLCAHVCVLPSFFSPLLFYTLLLTPFSPHSLGLAFCPERNPHPNDRCNSISVKKLKNSPGRASDKSMAVISRRRLQRICEKKKKKNELKAFLGENKQTNTKKAEQTLVSRPHKK